MNSGNSLRLEERGEERNKKGISSYNDLKLFKIEKAIEANAPFLSFPSSTKQVHLDV